jgi:hypothetical protein
MTQWAYPDGKFPNSPVSLGSWLIQRAGFESRTQIANRVNVGALVASLFLLASFAILPVKWTHRHYLGVCLTIAIVFMEVQHRTFPLTRLLTLKACLHNTPGG